MKLEFRKLYVEDIDFGESFDYQKKKLIINKKVLIDEILRDPKIISVSIDLAKPGESKRILPVKDVIEPRAKVNGSNFPGIVDEIKQVGEGITYSLKGCAVVTTGPIVGFQEGIIDMSGPMVEYTPFSKLNNIVLNIKCTKELDNHEHEELIRKTGLYVAQYIAKKFTDFEKYESVIHYFHDNNESTMSRFPRIGYVYLCMSQGLLHDTYFYGRDSKKIIPTFTSPLETIDGALVSGNCVSPGSKNTTYHHQNNEVINQLFENDGIEIVFAGTVLTPLMTTLADKRRNAMMTIKLMEYLKVDGVIISQEGFGNPTTDLMMISEGLEKKGIKTVLISNEDAGVDGRSEPLPDGNEYADAIISTGNSNQTITLPAMEIVLGELKEVERITGGFKGSVRPDGKLTIEVHGIMGSHNLLGDTKLRAVTK